MLSFFGWFCFATEQMKKVYSRFVKEAAATIMIIKIRNNKAIYVCPPAELKAYQYNCIIIGNL